MPEYSIRSALLNVKRALLDAVTPELRAVVVDLYQNRQSMYLWFYYDGGVSEDIIDRWEVSITEASAGMSGNCDLDEGIERIDYPKDIPFEGPVGGTLAFLRKESFTDKYQSNFERAVLEYPDPQSLINKFGDSSQKMINFQKNVGYSINLDTFEKIPTSWGMICDSTTGKRVIPVYPNSIENPNFLSSVYASLAASIALLGRVTPELRSVIVDVIDQTKSLYVRFYYDGEVPDELIALWDEAISEICASVGLGYTYDLNIERLDFPQKFPFRGAYAYIRKEKRLS